MQQRVVLVTGASSGFGKACAELLSENGYLVYGASRNPDLDASTSNLRPLAMDVRNDTSVNNAVQEILQCHSRLDVLINCAGNGYAGAVEEMSMVEYQSQFDTNFFGAVRTTKAVLPQMRKQRSGMIVNISSIGGVVGLPFQSAYSASKFALEGFTESLRIEMRPFNVKATLVQPGDFRTGFTDNRLFCAENSPESAYYAASQRAIAVTIAGEAKGPPPQQLATKLLSIIEAESPAVRYTAGPFMQRVAAKVKPVMPGRLFEYLIADEFDQ